MPLQPEACTLQRVRPGERSITRSSALNPYWCRLHRFVWKVINDCTEEDRSSEQDFSIELSNHCFTSVSYTGVLNLGDCSPCPTLELEFGRKSSTLDNQKSLATLRLSMMTSLPQELGVCTIGVYSMTSHPVTSGSGIDGLHHFHRAQHSTSRGACAESAPV